MAGHHAAALAAAAGDSRQKMREAYLAAGTTLQDDFHRAVGAPCGFARMSPNPRRRLSSTAYKQKQVEKQADEILQDSKMRAQQLRRAAEAQQEAILEDAHQRAIRRVQDAQREAEELSARSRAEDEQRRQNELEQLRTARETAARLIEQVVPDEAERTKLLARLTHDGEGLPLLPT